MSIKKIIDRIRVWFKFRRFRKFKLPLVKSVMPSLTVDKLVSVQPMTMPNDNIFHLDFTIDSRLYAYHIKLGLVVQVKKYDLVDVITLEKYKREDLYKVNRICKLKLK